MIQLELDPDEKDVELTYHWLDNFSQPQKTVFTLTVQKSKESGGRLLVYTNLKTVAVIESTKP